MPHGCVTAVVRAGSSMISIILASLSAMDIVAHHSVELIHFAIQRQNKVDKSDIPCLVFMRLRVDPQKE
jgi:hypothetical protein